MSFWDLEDGSSATETGTSYEVATANDPIPDGSSVLASVKDVKWDEWQQTEYLKLQWQVQKPEQFTNRTIFQKLYLTDLDRSAKDPAAKRDKAKRMFAAIDANAGGKLGRVGKKPTNEDLALALIGKPMVIRLQVWETDDGKTGNWIAAVSPRDHELKIGETKKRPAAKKEDDWGGPTRQQSRSQADLDDEVPF